MFAFIIPAIASRHRAKDPFVSFTTKHNDPHTKKRTGTLGRIHTQGGVIPFRLRRVSVNCENVLLSVAED